MSELYVLDALNLLFRAYYAIRGMTTPQGTPTGALYGFIRTVLKLIKEKDPKYLVIVFDGPESSAPRKHLYPQYKGHRAEMPSDLVEQMHRAIEFCQLKGISHLQIPRVEADDVIGSIASWAFDANFDTYIYSSDKDLCQLVRERVSIVFPHKDNEIVNREKVFELFQVWPEQMIDWLALVGDSSDNIPGVAGIGPKSAATLLETYGSLDEIFKHAPMIVGKKGEQLRLGKEKGCLSQKLAQLDRDVPIPREKEWYAKKQEDAHRLQELYRQMHFFSILQEETTLHKHSKTKGGQCLVTEKELVQAIQELKEKIADGNSEICIHTEHSEQNLVQGECIGMGLSICDKRYYIPCDGDISQKRIVELLQELFETKSLYCFGHHMKETLHTLRRLNIAPPTLCYDTVIASHLLSPERLKNNLELLSVEYLHHNKTPLETLIGKGKTAISLREVPIEKVSEYCLENLEVITELRKIVTPMLCVQKLDAVLAQIELPLIPVLFEMEERGVYVDCDVLHAIQEEVTKELKEVTARITELAGESCNLNSPKQLAMILFEKLKLPYEKKKGAGYSTNAEVLESLADRYPIAKELLQYRMLEKLRSTYIEALLAQINPKTKRVHCTFSQTIAATGRLACHDPNLQNIPVRSPLGKKIRSAFRPEDPSWRLVSLDYSQIELRFLAHFSQDETLCRAFEHGQDIHAYTASLVHGVAVEEVTGQMRHQAKAVNFGIIYGQQPFGLAKELGITTKEAEEFMSAYFDRYKKVKDYLDQSIEHVRRHGYAETICGRRRPIFDIMHQNMMLRRAAERLAINTPLQGSAADLIKMAMIEVKQMLARQRFSGALVLQVHDELIFESPLEEVGALGEAAQKVMQEVLPLRVPLVVEVSVGKNWGEC